MSLLWVAIFLASLTCWGLMWMCLCPAHRRPAQGQKKIWQRDFLLGMALLVLLCGLAPGLYALWGRPNYADQPLATRDPALRQAFLDYEEQIRALHRQIEQSPEDIVLWSDLALSYAALERYGQAAQAFREAARLGGNHPALRIAYAESLIRAQDGLVSPQAERILYEVYAQEPDNITALFFLGQAARQRGLLEDALSHFQNLARITPENAQWWPELRQLILQLAEELNIAPEEALPDPLPARSGPNAADIEAAAQLSLEEQQEMIASMVDSLAQRLRDNPDDIMGWQRLAESWLVLEEPEQALAAWQEAVELRPDSLSHLTGFSNFILEYRPDLLFDPQHITVLSRMVELDSTQPRALWLLGEYARQEGRGAQAEIYWRQALDLIDPQHPLYEQLRRRLNNIEEP